MTNLSLLTRLQLVSLKFDRSHTTSGPHPEGMRRTVSELRLYHDHVFMETLGPLVSLTQSSPIRCLRIINLPCDLSRNLTDQIGIHDILGKLHTLQLSLSSSAFDDTRFKRLRRTQDFLGYFLWFSQKWLLPAVNLTNLVLAANFHWGHSPKADFFNVHLPSLRALTLRNFVFWDAWVLPWLSKHSASLRQLYLDCSPIFVHIGVRPPYQTWEQYFHFFRDHLHQLNTFKIRHKGDVIPRDFEVSEPTSDFMSDEKWLHMNSSLSYTRYVTLLRGHYLWLPVDNGSVDTVPDKVLEEYHPVLFKDTRALDELEKAIRERVWAPTRVGFYDT